MANYSDIKYQPAGAATTIYSDMAALIAATGMSAGDQALVTALNKVFMYTGTAWYLVATMTNDSPTAITGVDGTYTLATDGTATTITAVSTDPEGFALTWSYAVTTGSLGSTATVSQTDNVFTITPSTTEADAGSFSITFSVTDGATGAVSAVSSFTLAFSVVNSRYTALSVRATNTGSNQTFDDASASNHTITVAGDTTASTFSPHRHGGYSTYFDGTGDYISAANNADFNVGSSDFTLECWAYIESVNGNAGICGSYTTTGNQRSYLIYQTDPSSGTKNFGVAMSGDGTWQIGSGFDSGVAVSNYLNQWVHLALTKSGTNATLYLNGNSIGTTSSAPSTLHSSTGEFIVGQTNGNNIHTTGYISDVRLVNGSVVYSSNFAPPTKPLTAITNTKILLGNLPYLKDQSTSNHTITIGGNPSLKPKSVFDNAPYSEAYHGASAYFGGIGDGINLNGDAEFAFGTNDFTVEFWLYPLTRTATEAQLVDFRGSSGNGTYTLLFLDNQYNTNNIIYYHQGGSRITSSPISDNAWSHVALTRSGNDVKLFVNGIQEGSTFTNSLTQLVGTNGPTFGAYHDGTYGLTGYMSDIRILNGTAAYTSNFTPPTAPLTAITNTKFLLNPETSISDLSQGNALICRGDLETSTTQVKFAGTKSIYLDGNGDYIRLEDLGKGALNTTSGFTIESWMYPLAWSASAAGSPALFGLNLISNGNNILVFTGFNGGTLYYGGSNYWTTSSDVSINQWSHIACVVVGTSIKLYLNGSEVLSETHPGLGTLDWEDCILAIGSEYDSGNGGNAANWFNGYIQDFRITKGLARYTANFTPPTAELEG